MVIRDRRPRFRLRTLLLAMLILGGGLGWWLRPFTLSKDWPNGQRQYELEVRRAWNGTLLTNGRQRWWWSNGQLAREGESFVQPLPRHLVTMKLQRECCWTMFGDHIDSRARPVLLDQAETYIGPAPDPPIDWSLYRFAETEHDP